MVTRHTWAYVFACTVSMCSAQAADDDMNRNEEATFRSIDTMLSCISDSSPLITPPHASKRFRHHSLNSADSLGKRLCEHPSPEQNDHALLQTQLQLAALTRQVTARDTQLTKLSARLKLMEDFTYPWQQCPPATVLASFVGIRLKIEAFEKRLEQLEATCNERDATMRALFTETFVSSEQQLESTKKNNLQTSRMYDQIHQRVTQAESREATFAKQAEIAPQIDTILKRIQTFETRLEELQDLAESPENSVAISLETLLQTIDEHSNSLQQLRQDLQQIHAVQAQTSSSLQSTSDQQNRYTEEVTALKKAFRIRDSHLFQGLVTMQCAIRTLRDSCQEIDYNPPRTAAVDDHPSDVPANRPNFQELHANVPDESRIPDTTPVLDQQPSLRSSPSSSSSSNSPCHPDNVPCQDDHQCGVPGDLLNIDELLPDEYPEWPTLALPSLASPPLSLNRNAASSSSSNSPHRAVVNSSTDDESSEDDQPTIQIATTKILEVEHADVDILGVEITQSVNPESSLSSSTDDDFNEDDQPTIQTPTEVFRAEFTDVQNLNITPFVIPQPGLPSNSISSSSSNSEANIEAIARNWISGTIYQRLRTAPFKKALSLIHSTWEKIPNKECQFAYRICITLAQQYLQHYEYTKEFKYLEKAREIYNSIATKTLKEEIYGSYRIPPANISLSRLKYALDRYAGRVETEGAR